MATVSATRASANKAIYRPTGSGILAVAWGTYAHASNLAATTIIEYCRVPAGSTVVGGFWYAGDLDTNGTEELDIDIGWAANGVEAADPDGFGNLDVLTGDASVHNPVAGIWIPLAGVLRVTGPQFFTKETVIQAVVNVDAATGGTGQSTMVVHYTVE